MVRAKPLTCGRVRGEARERGREPFGDFLAGEIDRCLFVRYAREAEANLTGF